MLQHLVEARSRGQLAAIFAKMKSAGGASTLKSPAVQRIIATRSKMGAISQSQRTRVRNAAGHQGAKLGATKSGVQNAKVLGQKALSVRGGKKVVPDQTKLSLDRLKAVSQRMKATKAQKQGHETLGLHAKALAGDKNAEALLRQGKGGRDLLAAHDAAKKAAVNDIHHRMGVARTLVRQAVGRAQQSVASNNVLAQVRQQLAGLPREAVQAATSSYQQGRQLAAGAAEKLPSS